MLPSTVNSRLDFIAHSLAEVHSLKLQTNYFFTLLYGVET